MSDCLGCGYAGHDHSLLESNTKRPRVSLISSDAEVSLCESVDNAVERLNDNHCLSALVRRPLSDGILDTFGEYVDSRPTWPNTEDYHPLEATRDRVAVIDFSEVSCSETDAISLAKGYGRNLAPRRIAKEGSGLLGIKEVVKVLPEDLRVIVELDAIALLSALHAHTDYKQFQLRLELVIGDTCQKWHCDQNISRALVTYVGPGYQSAGTSGDRLLARNRFLVCRWFRSGHLLPLRWGLHADVVAPLMP